jgi:hypothetical protein
MKRATKIAAETKSPIISREFQAYLSPAQTSARSADTEAAERKAAPRKSIFGFACAAREGRLNQMAGMAMSPTGMLM